MSAILISGYEYVELKGRLNKYNHIDSDYEECVEGENDFHKNDHLTDWEEVGVDYWTDPDMGLMSYDDEGNAILPTIMDCLEFTELTYVEEGLKRCQQDLKYNFGEAIRGKRVLPILSDPTRADSDGDGIVDKYDPNPLMAIDVDTPCLYDKGGIFGVENHAMQIDFGNACESYFCVNCNYEAIAPELQDDKILSNEEYIIVQSLLSLYKYFESMEDHVSKEVVYSAIDNIREIKAKYSYDFCSSDGSYATPFAYLCIDENNEYFMDIHMADTTLSEWMMDNVVYGGKTLIDAVALGLSPTWYGVVIGVAWTIISAYGIMKYEESKYDFIGTVIGCTCTITDPIWPISPTRSQAFFAISAINQIGISLQDLESTLSGSLRSCSVSVRIRSDSIDIWNSLSLSMFDVNDLKYTRYNQMKHTYYDANGSLNFKNALNIRIENFDGTTYDRMFGLIGNCFFRKDTSTFEWQQVDERTLQIL